MTKKHFEWAAQHVREYKYFDGHEREASTEVLVRLFSEFNPRFNADRFRAACRAEDYHDGRITHRYSKAS